MNPCEDHGTVVLATDKVHHNTPSSVLSIDALRAFSRLAMHRMWIAWSSYQPQSRADVAMTSTATSRASSLQLSWLSRAFRIQLRLCPRSLCSKTCGICFAWCKRACTAENSTTDACATGSAIKLVSHSDRRQPSDKRYLFSYSEANRSKHSKKCTFDTSQRSNLMHRCDKGIRSGLLRSCLALLPDFHAHCWVRGN
jgi:hypothetical protein